jgi:hypothetical protein
MTEQGVLVLVGAEALQLKDRLEASGYTTLEWVTCSLKPPAAWCVVARGRLA